MFVTTLSFTLTTPDSWVWVEGFFVPRRRGAFLIKDVFIFGAALVLTGEALLAARGHQPHLPLKSYPT
jgi:uncharacterized membrane protein YkgB